MFPRLFTLLLLAIPLHAGAAPSAAVATTAASEPSPAPQRQTIVHDGQEFELANSTTNKNVETDEYTVAGEKIANWTQLVTVQRLTLPNPTDSDAFVGYFKQRVTDDGASLDVLSQGKTASVFAVRFPKSEKNDEQVMICLAFADAAKPTQLNIVQYAIKPTLLPVATTATHIKSWRDKFLAQAHSLSPP